ncbi:Butirosin biosynthesis, BtrG-like protein [Lasiosphaeris hirsuta]|uniref:gamma-glutamylcyclotransferase n=1 Tax=Lasiosphaeris hirsuta TaxID=260670 RepID=A0AA40ECG5_9PEZI|nr:Butirosin biosynthesis, BtrG-like protein [Lasiosphaeris hirsuta]
MADADAPTKIYFGYGSNLWQDQMARRCPSSPFTGVGRLRGWQWIINSRGYANITKTVESDQVWGLIYELPPDDEASLDINEGVPFAYEKRMIEVEFWEQGALPADNANTSTLPPPTKVDEMLVYIDFERSSGEDNVPQPEYVHRMNEGIRDALKEGVPKVYIDTAVRKYIPTEEEASNEGRELARLQAVAFNDESGVFTRTESGVEVAPVEAQHAGQ